MRGLITYVISILLLGGSSSTSAIAKKDVDSIMFSMNHEEKIKSLLWVEVNSFSDISNHPSHHQFYLSDSIYLAEDLASLSHITLAKKLNKSLNPSHRKDLPDIAYLAAINEKEILHGYFTYLRALGHSMNYGYLVLPESSNPRERAVLKKLHDFDSGYFIKNSLIAAGIPPKRKEIKSLFTTHDYWLVPSGKYPEAVSLIEKLDEKITLNQKDHLITTAMINQFNWNLSGEPQMTPQQRMSLRQSAIALIEKESWLPLNRDTVCFLSNDPYGEMANMLRNYAYVITDLDEIHACSAPIIADFSPLLPGSFQDRAVIYIGDLQGFDENFFNVGLIVPEQSVDHHYILPQQIFGAASITGVITDRYEILNQFKSKSLDSKGVLGFAPAYSVGLFQSYLDSITKIIQHGIEQKAFPGCQLAIAVKGSIVYDQTFGHLTYDKMIPVYPSTMFDLASVTKVAGTLLMTMKLYDEQKLNLDQTIGHYLPRYLDSNKKGVTIKALLAHQAGLLPYVPFWKRVLTADFLDPFYYASIDDELMDQRSYDIGSGNILKDSLSQWILSSRLLSYDSMPYYSYSDIGFMILQEVLEAVAGQPMDAYLNQQFFEPLNLNRITFNPKRAGVDLFEIAPTEYDSYYRSEQIWGEVHDRNAAILDGVAGHAGLFSNARDMLVLFQMTLQGGMYDGKRFFKQETLAAFNQRYYPDNRRGLGWDKKSEQVGNVSILASDESYGHTGFTGTMAWVDPKYDLVFIFLTNRIHPSANNRKLNQLDIRTKIQDVVYKALETKNHGQNYSYDLGVNP